MSLASLLKEHGQMRTYRHGTSVLLQGEIPRHVYVVLDGLVRAYTISSSGEERYVGLYGKGDVFPLSFAIGEATSALFYYEAVSDTRALCVDKPSFDNALLTNHDAATSLLAHVGREYTTLTLRLTALAQARTIEKLAYTFYFLVFRYGIEREKGWYVIDIKLTQSMLGSLIGQTREGTARNLKQLVRAGVVQYKGSLYSVHREKLISFLGEDAFRDIAQH
ncbi:MAG TPA: Crp/Fnr family transcriptional regulator [Patescibacteria group bacterium]|jgi:CRP/FNR family transcriptional regulator|nr:Crp/Fnr family transcriptional regulator [Patescibacteria group bacterium]